MKFLIGCTPNGCISFVLQLYVESTSDFKLIQISGLLDHL